MLKISKRDDNGTVTLRVEGRIIGPWVAELRTCCEAALADRQAFDLELQDVEYADAAALELLLNLPSRGARVTNCSPFLAEQLRARSPSKGA